jgi:hypothetical protein
VRCGMFPQIAHRIMISDIEFLGCHHHRLCCATLHKEFSDALAVLNWPAARVFGGPTPYPSLTSPRPTCKVDATPNHWRCGGKSRPHYLRAAIPRTL